MEINFNGQTERVSEEVILTAILRTHSIDKNTGGIAVAVNGCIVLRNNWNSYIVQEGDCIEVVHAVQGG